MMRYKRVLLVLFIMLGLWVCFAGAVMARESDLINSDLINSDLINNETMLKEKKENQLIIQFNDSKDGIEARSLFSLPAGEMERLAPAVYSLTVNEPEEDVWLRELEKNKAVVAVEKNLPRQLLAAGDFPNDPYYAEQWALESIDAREAWRLLPAGLHGVKVAVIDSGLIMNPPHEDLQRRIDHHGYNFLTGSDDVYDLNGHGTSVAGIIAAITNNHRGIAGVAGLAQVRILPLQVSFQDGLVYEGDIIRAIDYAMEQGVDVINLSLGGAQYSSIENNMIQKAIEKDIVIVAAAGNKGNDHYFYPASYEHVISVGSVDASDQCSKFSNYNDQVDVVAPGEKVITTGRGVAKYHHLSGTSVAAPVVSGVVSLLKAADPSLSSADVREILAETAIDLGPPGWDACYGYGKINAAQAVKKLVPAVIETDWITFPMPPERIYP